jgi:hypothetical protein
MRRCCEVWILTVVFAHLLIADGVIAQEAASKTETAVTLDAADRGNTLIPFPFLYYTPETKTAFGGMLAYYLKSADDTTQKWTSGITPVVIYTQKRQFITAAGADLYFRQGQYHLLAGISFLHFPDTFWGIGNNAPDDREEDFTRRLFSTELLFEKQFIREWFAGCSVAYAQRQLREIEAGGLLDTGHIAGVQDGSVVGIGIQLAKDSRDDTIFPRRGDFHLLGGRLFDSILGSDYEYGEAYVDLRKYVPLNSRRILAVRLLGMFSNKIMPFDRLPGLGGDRILRGYYAGRFRDRNLLATQAELRAHLWRRLKVVAFAGAGQVAHRLSRFRGDSFRASGGAGIRFLLSKSEELHLRADVGIGKNSSGFYLGIGEVF